MEILMKLTLLIEFLGITFNCQICRETNKKLVRFQLNLFKPLKFRKFKKIKKELIWLFHCSQISK